MTDDDVQRLAAHVARLDGAVASLVEDVRLLLAAQLRHDPDAFDRWQRHARERVALAKAEAAVDGTMVAHVGGLVEASERLLTTVPPLPAAWRELVGG